MATYLPGVTDYIPRIQPFQPDLNFYQKALESKEADYKAGYDKISNVYGTLLNSDMLRADNIETRDKFFNQIQNDIQRMSTVDLSLRENQNTAYKVFQPLIDDKYVAKDMSFTKKYRGQKNFAQYLKTCFEKECEGKYWDDGLRAVNYQAEDFVEADRESSLSIGDPSYTPYSSGYNKAMKMAKDMGIEIQNVSHDPTGRYLVTTKNGQQISGQLANYFVAAMADDASTTAVYNTKAYLQRKDYAAQHASEYGGDKLAAERAYLTAAPGSVLKVMENYNALTNRTLATQEQKKKLMEKKIAKEGINPTAQKSFVDDWYNTQEQIAINARASEEYSSAISTLKRADVDDLNNLRASVDRSVSKALMVEDMSDAATTYAALTKSESWTADPYVMEGVKHQYRLKEGREKFNYDVFLEKYKNDLKNGLIAAPTEWTAVDATPGGTGKTPLKETINLNQTRFTEEAKEAATAYNKKVYDYYDKLRNSKDPDEAKYGAEQLKTVFRNYIDASYGLKDFNSNPAFGVEGNSDSWKAVYSRAVSALKGDTHIMSANDQLSMTELSQMEKTVSTKLQAQEGISKVSMGYNKDSATYLKHYGSSKFKSEADMLFDKDGRERTKTQFIQDFKMKHLTPGDPLSAEDPGAIYDELSEEFLEIYNEKRPASMQKSTGSIFSGGGIMDRAAMMAKFDAAAISLKERGNLLSLKDDLYRKGAFVMTGPNLVGEEGRIYSAADNQESAKQFMAAVLDAATRGGWDPKTEGGKKRPIFTITSHSTALNQPGMQAYTLGIDPFFAEQMRGTGTKAGVASKLFAPDGTLIDREITLYVPDSEAKNEYFQRSKLTAYDVILDTQGSYVIDDYSNGGGKIEVTRNADGLLVGNPTLQRLLKDGTFTSDVFQRYYAEDPSTSAQAFIEGASKWLAQYQQDNLYAQQEHLKTLPKQKTL